MKRNILTVSLIASLFVVMIGCSKSSPKKVTKNLADGSWSITYYEDNATDETSNFSNMLFDFDSNGTVSVNGTTSGSWSVGEENSNDDSSSGVKLNLAFTPTALLELNDDWDIVSQSDNKIELIDESGDGSIDKLTFEKQ